MRQLKLYTTSACHLCEIAEALISPELAKHDLDLVLIEISDSDDLLEKYGVRIPVLSLEGCSEELGWPFDKTQLLDFVSTN